MSNEDKMREEFVNWWLDRKPRHDWAASETEAWIIWKACAAIKDAEIEREKLYSSMQFDQINELKSEIASHDLMIKELREALKGEYTENKKNGCETLDTTLEALAKSEHHNSRTLEKMLLEAEDKGYKRGIIRGQNSLN